MSSEIPENNKEEVIHSALRTKNLKIPHELIPPQQINSVHVDNALVAIDHASQMVTITLMSSHPVPKYSDGWTLNTYNWEIVGELKMPITAMTQMAIYYMTAMSGGIDVLRLVQMEMQKQNKQPPKDGVSYGPFGWSQSPHPQT